MGIERFVEVGTDALPSGVVLVGSSSSVVTLHWRRKRTEKKLIDREKAEMLEMTDNVLNEKESK